MHECVSVYVSLCVCVVVNIFNVRIMIVILSVNQKYKKSLCEGS